MKRQIVITRVLEFGGNNTYLKNLIKYFGAKNLIIVLKSPEELVLFRDIDPAHEIVVRIIPNLRRWFDFKERSFFHNLKDVLSVLKSVIKIFSLSARNRFTDISVSAIDAENYLYLFWLPFISVKYILHSEPLVLRDRLTPITCNNNLGRKKKIITVSLANRNAILAKWRISDKKAKYVHVVYNGLTDIKRERRVYMNGEDQIVLTMGHVIDYKNPHLWLNVARRVIELHKNASFYWLGNGPLLAYFQSQTNNSEKINFVGLINDTDSYLKRATIYYQPSLIETQGIAVIEAMSNHLPCVVTNVGGLPESVTHNKNGFVVKADDIDENVDFIATLLENESLRDSFGQSSYDRYRELFVYDVFKKKMDKIYYKQDCHTGEE